MKCQATTSSGKSCSREATYGSYCWQHKSSGEKAVAKKSKSRVLKPKVKEAKSKTSPKKTSSKKSTVPTADQKKAWLDWLEIMSGEIADYGVDLDELEDVGVTERQIVWALSTSGTGKAKVILDKVANSWDDKKEGKETVAILKRLKSEIQDVDTSYLPFPYEAIEWRR